MAKIPLRAYLNEVENLIDRGEIEQAIAHAKNILRAYPKHIDTYRLLGKAFLESQRYSEAADILQRVLSVIPDDFVSQLGMSIIREDEGNLDAAIWHMERAYEVQPFNPAVQDELRRLYGKRDGVEPPKIRLTRGALVRMYARGELYPQAIAETRAALAEDPQRFDLRVLLARLYYQSGQKNDAAEVCSELISKLPYCYEANRLLTEILPTTSRADETPKFQQRIYALDPYEAFVSPSAPTSQQVPDQAVMVEQFIWEPGAETGSETPEWARTVGVAWEETEEEDLPDWLNTLTPGVSQAPQAQEFAPPAPVEDDLKGAIIYPVEEEALQEDRQEASEQSAEDLVPDWMKEAGWTATDRSADEIMAEQVDQSSDEEALQPAEIPDWLQAMAPPEAAQSTEEEAERTDWLEEILDQPAGTGDSETLQAVTQVDQQEPGLPEGTAEPQETPELPDWMAGLENVEESTQEEMPDWMAQLGADQVQDFSAETTAETISTEGAEEQEPASDAEIPDWLQSFGSETEAGQPETTPDWMDTLSAESADAAAPEPSEPAVQEEVEEKFEPAAEELPTGSVETAPTTEEAAAAERTTPSDLGMPPMPDMNDIDATMAWLEMLASRQGADEATLITSPEQRTETPPEWVQQLETSSSEQEVESTAAVEDSTVMETPAEEQKELTEEPSLPDWLAEAEQETVSPETEQPEPAIGELADFTQPEEAISEAIGEDKDSIEALPAAEAEMPDLTDEAAALAWLEGLAARQGADEATLITSPEERTEQPPDWLLNEIGPEEKTQPIQIKPTEQATEEPVAVAPEAEPPMTEAEPIEADLPDWLRSEEVELTQQEPVSPAAVDAELAELQVEQEEPVSGEEAAGEKPEIFESDSTAPVEAAAATGEMAAPDLSDMDAAMAWLESLAARQGADEETLITAPEERTETPPEWVQKLEAEETAPASESGAEEPIPEWLAEMEPPEDEIGLPFGVERDGQSWMEGETPTEEELAVLAGQAVEDTPQGDADQPVMETRDEEAATTAPLEEETSPEVEIPSWLQDLEQTTAGQQEEQVPEWMSGLAAETTEEPSQWIAESETPASAEEPLPDWLAGLEEESGMVSAEEEMIAAPADYRDAWEPEISPEVVFEQPASPEATTPVERPPQTLAEMQAALNRGDIDLALEGYTRLINEEQHLEEVIRDLRDALYRYPVDIGIWQALGDAYARNNQLQEALDAYTKAEELLR